MSIGIKKEGVKICSGMVWTSRAPGNLARSEWKLNTFTNTDSISVGPGYRRILTMWVHRVGPPHRAVDLSSQYR